MKFSSLGRAIAACAASPPILPVRAAASAVPAIV
jgi:hypothetical protein